MQKGIEEGEKVLPIIDNTKPEDLEEVEGK
jgi:hypothetical protein